MISLYDLLEVSNGQLYGESAAQIFSGFCLDVRHAKESQIFVALKTDHGDTHYHIQEAVQRGVTGVICTHPPEFETTGISVILTRDPETALMNWTHFILGKMGVAIVGVTGSSGKSTAVETIRRVLSTRYLVHTGTTDQQGRLGLPLSLGDLTPDHRFVVLELALTQPGEMGAIVQAIRPDVGVVTNVDYAHTNRFGDLDEIAGEMGILIEYLSLTGLAVLNYDDDRVRGMMTRTSRARTITVGTEGFGADLMAYNIVMGLNGTGYDLRHGSDRYVGRWTPLLGKRHIHSILSALAVGIHYGIPPDEALKALKDMAPLPGRMSPLPGIEGSTIIDDTYDANPQSTLAALDWLNAVKEKNQRTIFVLGDIENLGPHNYRGHRIIGQRAAEVASIIVTAGTNSALTGRAALDQGINEGQVNITYSVEDAINVLKQNIAFNANDIVLIKGGRPSRMEMLVEALLKNPEDRAKLPRRESAIDRTVFFQPTYPSWLELDYAALGNNVRALKAMVGENVALMAVVKADAYGHGAVAVSRTALANGAEYLAVASVNEAVALREAGINAPILVLSYTSAYNVLQAIRQNIAITIYDLELAQRYDQFAREVGGRLRVHVKVDTGMGRLGVLPRDSMNFFRHISTLHYLDVEGVYTHFSMADEDPAYTETQMKTFKNIINPLRAAGYNFRYVHAANSAALLSSRDSHFDMVRAGIAMYGLSPSEKVRVPDTFQPVMSWKSVIAQVKTLPQGSPVGYGQSYHTADEERIAVIPVGYSDGFRRKPNNWGQVLVRGQFAPVVGRVSMEKTTINVTHIPDVTIGDEVVLLGKQGDNIITAEDVARKLATNNYEVVCSILARVPRR